MLMEKSPVSRSRRNMRTMSSGVCALPMRSKVRCCIVCGFTLTRLTRCFFIESAFSGVIVSGRPASTVNSPVCSP